MLKNTHHLIFVVALLLTCSSAASDLPVYRLEDRIFLSGTRLLGSSIAVLDQVILIGDPGCCTSQGRLRRWARNSSGQPAYVAASLGPGTTGFGESLATDAERFAVVSTDPVRLFIGSLDNATPDFEPVNSPMPLGGSSVSVDIDGVLAVVGIKEYVASGSLDTGLVVVWQRNSASGEWDVLQEIATPGGTTQLFGAAVAISGDVLLVGSETAGGQGNGSVRTYQLDPATGTFAFSAEFNAPADVLNTGDAGFGGAIAFDEAGSGRFAVGAMRAQLQGSSLSDGAVFVYTPAQQVGQYRLDASLRAPDATRAHGFGFSLALRDDLLLIGAPDGNLEDGETGTAYLAYGPDGSNWTLVNKLAEGLQVANARFGHAVAFDGDRFLVGAPQWGANATPGRVFDFASRFLLVDGFE